MEFDATKFDDDVIIRMRVRNYSVDFDGEVYVEGRLIKEFETPPSFGIKKVIFNNPATIVLWDDGTKTVVKCSENDRFDPEKGLAMAISEKALGGYGPFKKLIQNYYAVDPKDDDDFDWFCRELFEPIRKVIALNE